ncbi:hypothetical protein CHU98_g11588 [Xylaria longipes]|nr:hypothetical protein CHU98_g11588 [Xylaria longipes]
MGEMGSEGDEMRGRHVDPRKALFAHPYWCSFVGSMTYYSTNSAGFDVVTSCQAIGSWGKGALGGIIARPQPQLFWLTIWIILRTAPSGDGASSVDDADDGADEDGAPPSTVFLERPRAITHCEPLIRDLDANLQQSTLHPDMPATLHYLPPATTSLRGFRARRRLESTWIRGVVTRVTAFRSELGPPAGLRKEHRGPPQNSHYRTYTITHYSGTAL